MKERMINAKCPHCKQEYNSRKNWHSGVSSLHGQYSSGSLKMKCEHCKEMFELSVVRTTKYTGKKIKVVKTRSGGK